MKHLLKLVLIALCTSFISACDEDTESKDHYTLLMEQSDFACAESEAVTYFIKIGPDEVFNKVNKNTVVIHEYDHIENKFIDSTQTTVRFARLYKVKNKYYFISENVLNEDQVGLSFFETNKDLDQIVSELFAVYQDEIADSNAWEEIVRKNLDERGMGFVALELSSEQMALRGQIQEDQVDLKCRRLDGKPSLF